MRPPSDPHHQGVEPPRLPPIREDGIANAREAIRTGRPISYGGYQEVKKDLADAQSRKCCYCEILEQGETYRDVEHYRPKAAYWWLTWTWDNLYFVCFECNRTSKKAKFPLAEGSTRLVAEQAPPGQESALVLDPGAPSVDPVSAIQFCREKVAGLERWVPRPRNGNILGRTTIEVCGLDRQGLLTLYADHVQSRVRPKMEGVSRALKSGDEREIQREWRSATGALVRNRAAPFRALSYDAIDVLVLRTVRDRYRLQLDPPR